MRPLYTKHEHAAPLYTRVAGRQRLFFLRANATRVPHARAQTTTAARNSRQNGRAMRVQPEENVPLTTRMMVVLEAVAKREPVTCTSEHA